MDLLHLFLMAVIVAMVFADFTAKRMSEGSDYCWNFTRLDSLAWFFTYLTTYTAVIFMILVGLTQALV